MNSGGGGVKVASPSGWEEALCPPPSLAHPWGPMPARMALDTHLKTPGLPDASCPEEPWTQLPRLNGTVPITGDSGPEVPLVAPRVVFSSKRFHQRVVLGASPLGATRS